MKLARICHVCITTSMAEIELIQDRLISGKGLLRVPTDVVKNRIYILYVDIIRKPTNQYLNFNYNPPRSRYATLTFFRNDYLIDEKSIDYPKQVFDGINDICGQTMLAVKCAYKGILQTFVNLGLALDLIPISVTDTIEAYQNLRLAWDEVRITCYADTAIQCRLYRLKYDVCDPDLDDDYPPPPPDAPVESVPPGTPIDNLSPAYDEENDDGDSIPFPGDSPPPPPEPCTTIIHGAGLNNITCGTLAADTDYAFEGYATLVPVTVPPNGCSGLQLYIDGVDQGSEQVFHPTAYVVSYSETCEAPD